MKTTLITALLCACLALAKCTTFSSDFLQRYDNNLGLDENEYREALSDRLLADLYNENADYYDESSLDQEDSSSYPLEQDIAYADNFENNQVADPNQHNPSEAELESHSSFVNGNQYVSGGAGEGIQHLKPDGAVDNKNEVKSDEDLPAYCNPPNPCPIGYTGEDCDRTPFTQLDEDYSKMIQSQQNCMCDSDHNKCSKPGKSPLANILNGYQLSAAVAKKSPIVKRTRRNAPAAHKFAKNPYLAGKKLDHVAKKSNPM